jgi:hypothetical protein
MSMSPRLLRGTSLPPKAMSDTRTPVRQAVSRDTSPVAMSKRGHRRSSSGRFIYLIGTKRLKDSHIYR